LFVARTRHTLPLSASLLRKFDALSRVLDVRVVAPAKRGVNGRDERFRLLRAPGPARLDGVLFHLLLPFAVRGQLREFDPAVVVVEDPYLGFAVLLGRRLAGRRTPLVVELHGDWRTATRLYGAPLRKVLAPLADQLGVIAVRRAEGIRAVSNYTAWLASEIRHAPVTLSFPAYMELQAFTKGPRQPQPQQPTLLFVGVLERYKGIDLLASAWRAVAARLPETRLVIVGRGARAEIVERLVGELPGRVEHVAQLPPEEIAELMDRSTALVLPSRSEGFGRVIIESFARGRPVVASAVGGIPELVVPGRNGLLFEPGDPGGLEAAMRLVASDPRLASQLAEGAAESFAPYNCSPEQFAARMSELVEQTLALTRTEPGPTAVEHAHARG
jgi:glycosyltransferase involved in cell wall biosynthesis